MARGIVVRADAAACPIPVRFSIPVPMVGSAYDMPSLGFGPNGLGRGLGLACGTGLALAALLTGTAVRGAGPMSPASEPKPAEKAVEKKASDRPKAGKEGAAPRVALTSTHTALKPDFSANTKAKAAAAALKTAVEEEPIGRAIRMIKACQEQYARVNDYTCTFYKREVVRGRLTPMFVMNMKARTAPKSIYFRFEEPYRGREAIYVEGRNNGKILAHDVGITRLLAGTMEIDPNSARAMEENRHPISHAGIGSLIETVVERWEAELRADESVVRFDPEMTIGPRACQMIESIHPRREPHFQFHKVRLFIDSELNLPIRFEGYEWPREEGSAPELVEEYTYIDLKVNVGLGDIDFDAANGQYAFGRF